MTSDDNSHSVRVIKEIFENRSKPILPTKKFRYINGRIIYDNTNENSANDVVSDLTLNSINNDLISESSDVDVIDGKEQSESESNSEFEALSKPECISRECLNYIEQVHRCLTYLKFFKEELDVEYADDHETMKTLGNVFRDVHILHSAYDIIRETIDRFRCSEKGLFYLYEVFLDPVVSNLLKMYKPFLSQYAINAKGMGEFAREQRGCIEAVDRAKVKHNIMVTMNMDNCLYTIFNSLFSLELMLDRYKKCFEEASEHFCKADEAKNLISNLLSVINTNQDQDNFVETQKQLNLLTGRSKLSKINTKFIYKGMVTKYARRDDRAMSRQLVLFSDCLFVTMPPGNIVGTSSVRQELSIDSMKVSEIAEGEMIDMHTNLKHGLSINALEAVQDFYFDSEEIMKTWKDKILYVIKEEAGSNTGEYINRKPSIRLSINEDVMALGSKAPRWQKDKATWYCNGHRCNQRFTTTSRRHHCRADGLLYCDACCNFRIKLEFDRAEESRVCELCYEVLYLYQSNPTLLEQAKQQLSAVMDKKTHQGKKTGWLVIRKYNKDKGLFMAEANYYCNLHSKDAILLIYERHEDKCQKEIILLLGMEIKTSQDVSQYYKTISSKQFIIEHRDKMEAYLMKAPSPEECSKWVQCFKERISTNLYE